jgi:serine/threonine protein kinase/tetratricopeptide (TPR) repeat protein
MLRDSGAYGLGGRFLLEAAIGTGSMGTVFRARDTRDDRVVAIKSLKSIDPGDMLRFEREFALVSRLSHPAIVACWEIGRTETGECYFVMEWLEGESLRERLRRSELSLEETLALAVRLLEGLAHAHGIVHRDVKPANVFLVKGDVRQAKLVDFGIARLIQEGETLTRAGEIVGTPGYVSPEQVKGRRVDQRSDVYSLGCLLFRCLTGRAVFEDENVLEVLVRVTRDRAPALAELRPDLPAALAGLIDRMLEREPVDRPGNAAGVLRELELLVGPTLTLGDPALLASEPEAQPRRSRTSSIAQPGEGSIRETSTPSRSTSLNAAGPATKRPRASWRGIVGIATAALVATAIGVTLLLVRPVPRELSPANMLGGEAIAGDAFADSDQIIGKDARPAWGLIQSGSRASALRRLGDRAQERGVSASELLWYALLSPPGDETKRHHRTAGLYQSELTPFERQVLSAMAPLLKTPSDFGTANTQLTALAEESRSAELWLVLARLRTQMNDRAAAFAAVEEIERGRWWTAAQVERIWLDREFYDVEAGRRDALACTQARPDAVDCIAALSRRAAADGDCAEMEQHARRWVGTDPDDPFAYEMVAMALAARGATDEALLEGYEQKWARLPERDRAAAKLKDEINLAALRGRFDKAAALSRSSLAELPADAPLLQRLIASFTLLLAVSEMEDKRVVAEISQSVLVRATASTPSTPTEAAYFLLFSAASERADDDERWTALREEAFKRFDAYIVSQGENLRPYQRAMPWIVGFAAGVDTDVRMKAAYAAKPRYGALPPPGVWTDDVDLVIGKVLAGNGESEAGLAYLRRASKSCLILENPYAVVRTHTVLGEFLEKLGQEEEAREAYGRAIAVWGDAKPRSRSARRAREGLERMGGKPATR